MGRRAGGLEGVKWVVSRMGSARRPRGDPPVAVAAADPPGGAEGGSAARLLTSQPQAAAHPRPNSWVGPWGAGFHLAIAEGGVLRAGVWVWDSWVALAPLSALSLVGCQIVWVVATCLGAHRQGVGGCSCMVVGEGVEWACSAGRLLGVRAARGECPCRVIAPSGVAWGAWEGVLAEWCQGVA